MTPANIMRVAVGRLRAAAINLRTTAYFKSGRLKAAAARFPAVSVRLSDTARVTIPEFVVVVTLTDTRTGVSPVIACGGNNRRAVGRSHTEGMHDGKGVNRSSIGQAQIDMSEGLLRKRTTSTEGGRV